MRSNEGIDFIKNICCAKQNFQLHPLPSHILKRSSKNLGNVMLISHIISQMLFMNHASFSFLQCQTTVLIPGKLTRVYSSSECLRAAIHGDVLKYIELFIKSETENRSFQECVDSLTVSSAETESSAIVCSLLANYGNLLV